MPVQAAAEAISHCRSSFIYETDSRETAHLTQKVDPRWCSQTDRTQSDRQCWVYVSHKRLTDNVRSPKLRKHLNCYISVQIVLIWFYQVSASTVIQWRQIEYCIEATLLKNWYFCYLSPLHFWIAIPLHTTVVNMGSCIRVFVVLSIKNYRVDNFANPDMDQASATRQEITEQAS